MTGGQPTPNEQERMALLARQVGHDFNNYLSSIIGYASLLKSKLEGDEKLLRYASMIEESGNEAGASAERLLNYGRSWTVSPSVMPCSLESLIHEVQRVMESDANADGLTVKAEPADLKGRIAIDLRQLQSALEALRANVVDQHNGEDLIPITLRFAQVATADLAEKPAEDAPSGQWLVIEIGDSGPGMDEETLAQSTSPGFTTVKGARRQGLGLPTVMGFVHAHHGQFEIVSTSGEGTTVTLRLPIHEMG